MKTNINSILIPNKVRIGEQKETPKMINKSSALNTGPTDFEKLLNRSIDKNERPVKISAHANKRLLQRDMKMDQQELKKINDAMNSLALSGGKESLVLTKNRAYVVDVPNRQVVTAMEKSNMDKNIFTNIDSTILVDL